MRDKHSFFQKGFVLWFTGLSGSGKTTNALEVYKQLKKEGFAVEYLDGDVVRENLSHDLGFSKSDRDENIKRVSFVASLLSRNGVGVICSFISPYKSQREVARKKSENFIEVFCNCSLERCEQRDKKGLYKKARAGEIDNFTGVSDVYEKPENPNLVLDTYNQTPEETTALVINYLNSSLFLKEEIKNICYYKEAVK
jgi:adenylyl-sulfate kinase